MESDLPAKKIIVVGDYLRYFGANNNFYYPWVKVLSIEPNSECSSGSFNITVQYYPKNANTYQTAGLMHEWIGVMPEYQDIAHNEEDIAMWTLANI